MEKARYDEFWEELQKALGSAQWSRRLVVPSPGSPKAKETKPAKPTIKKEYHDDGGSSSSHKQDQEHLLLLDLPSRTLSLLTTTSSSKPREGGREGGFYSLILDPTTLQACQEEIMEYNSMADFAFEFAEALQGKKTVEIKLGGEGGGGGGGKGGATAPAVVKLLFNTQKETMSISLPCLQEGVCAALLPAFRPFFHFNAATGIGGQPAAVGGEEGGVKAAVATGEQKRPKSEQGGGGGGGRGGGGGGQRIVQSLVHPGLAVRSTVTGSKWEDEDEREEEGRKKKKGEGAEENMKNGKEGAKRE